MARMGLIRLGSIPEHPARDEFQILKDEPVYTQVKNYAPAGTLQEMDMWSRSFYTLEGHLEAIQQFAKPLLQQPNDGLWQQAKREVLSEFQSFDRVDSLNFETQLKSVPFEATSAAGYGYDGKKSEGNNLNRATSIANAAIRSFAERVDEIGFDDAITELADISTPDMAFTRTQLARLPSIKVRNVFGEAFHYILIEGLSAAPLLEAFKRGDTFYFTGKDPTVFVPRLLTQLARDGVYFIVLDWTGFDASIQNYETDHAFACLESMLQFPTLLSRRAFQYSKAMFQKRKLAGPDGQLWMRTGGIPSGSYFTNLIGSIANYTRIKYICLKLRYNIVRCYVQGDDSLSGVLSHTRPDPYDIADVGKTHGWILRPEKCMITERTEDVTFLGRGVLYGLNVRERLKVLRLMCFPEYKVDDPKISTARVHAIMRDSGYVDSLVDMIYGGLFRLYGEAQQVPEHLRTYSSKFDVLDVNM